MSVAEPTVALVFSPEGWVEQLHRHLADHGGARIRQIVVEPSTLRDEEFDVLVVSHRWPTLTPVLVRRVQEAGARVLGVFDRDEPAAREHLAADRRGRDRRGRCRPPVLRRGDSSSRTRARRALSADRRPRSPRRTDRRCRNRRGRRTVRGRQDGALRRDRDGVGRPRLFRRSARRRRARCRGSRSGFASLSTPTCVRQSPPSRRVAMLPARSSRLGASLSSRGASPRVTPTSSPPKCSPSCRSCITGTTTS